MTTETRERKRRPAARHRDIVLGGIDERLRMIPVNAETEPHRNRLLELLDELRRSLNKEEGE